MSGAPSTPRADRRAGPSVDRGEGGESDQLRPNAAVSPLSSGSGPNVNLSLNTSRLSSSSGYTSGPVSPVRFAATSNAFGLAVSPVASTSTGRERLSPTTAFPPGMSIAAGVTASAGSTSSPPSAGTVTTRRMRRPSMLSLTQTPITATPPSLSASAFDDGEEESTNSPMPHHDTQSQPQQTSLSQPVQIQQPNAQPLPRWVSPSTFLNHPTIRRVSSAPPLAIEALTTSTPPLPGGSPDIGFGAKLDGDAAMDMDSGIGSSSILADGERRSPLKWLPSHLHAAASRRKGKARADDFDILPEGAGVGEIDREPDRHQPPFHGRPLPGALLATLISESEPLEHEMRSEARLQRLLASHPSALPFTPRQRRNTRGRYPEMVGDDDDDEMGTTSTRHWSQRWRGNSTDSDSDDMTMDDSAPDWQQAGAVNMEFASAMDMDRPGSNHSSSIQMGARSDSGKSTPGHGRSSGSGAENSTQPTPPSNNQPWSGAGGNGGTLKPGRLSLSQSLGMVPSPGTGIALPSAFGSLAMGGGIGTPLGSPTVEKLESDLQLATSPGMSMSPGMMQYRESFGGSTSVRPGKRKGKSPISMPRAFNSLLIFVLAGATEDRFDPYKRPRGSSPSPFPSSASNPLSPSKPLAIPIPSSPSHTPVYSSNLAASASSFQLNRPPGIGPKQAHPYTRPMSSRSRAASPALSIGSTSGVLSSSLGNGGFAGGPSRPLGGPFIPTGPGASAAVAAAVTPGAAPQALGGLGLLSLAQAQNALNGSEHGERRVSDPESIEMIKEDSNESNTAMEED